MLAEHRWLTSITDRWRERIGELLRVITMSLNPNQMAYVAIVSTLIFGSIFVGVSGVLQTSEGLGNFDSAVEEDIAGDGIATNKERGY